MGYILMALFGGGTLDWEHISRTTYDWEDIFDRAKQNYDFENIDMCQLYETILEMALDELQEKMEEIADECSEEFQECAKDIYGHFEFFINFLDTKLYFRGSEELAEEIQEKLEDEIDDINFKIGFADIEF
jgi:hypothetical protein